MERLGEIWRRLLYLLRKRHFDSELEDEIQFHLERTAQRNRDAGMEAEEARFAARRQFGNVTRLKEKSHEAWGWLTLDELARDLRFGLRMLRKNRGFTAVAVCSLALGITTNTAVFTLVNNLLLQKLPVTDPDALVSMNWSVKGSISFHRPPMGLQIQTDPRTGSRILDVFPYAALEPRSGSLKRPAAREVADIERDERGQGSRGASPHG